MKHLSDATLQTYVDGELSPPNTKATKSHLATCATCAALLEEMKDEAMQVCGLLDGVMNAPVPSARLRQRLDAAVAQRDVQAEQYAGDAYAGSRSLSERVSDYFNAGFFTAPRAAFAGLAVAAACLLAFLVVVQSPKTVDDIASVKLSANDDEAFPPWSYGVQSKDDTNLIAVVAPPVRKPIATVASYDPARTSRGDVGQRQPFIRSTAQQERNAKAADALLPGEGGYLNAIVSLTNAIESNSSESLSPSLRAEYERNLAVVDQAITTTRTTAKRNPNDTDAAQFLFSAYQSKIELLNAVADQREIAQR